MHLGAMVTPDILSRHHCFPDLGWPPGAEAQSTAIALFEIRRSRRDEPLGAQAVE
jgi:hypothetical protein